MNWIEQLQQYTTALCQQIQTLTERLDNAEKEIARLREQLNEYMDREPEVKIELLTGDNQSPLSELLVPPVGNKESDNGNATGNNLSQPLGELSDLKVPIAKETKQEQPAEEAPQTVVEPKQENAPHKDMPIHDISSASAPHIDDLRKAISIGDRFLFQRELFASDGEKMNKTIDILNKMQSIDEAVTYIEKHFHWESDSQTTQLFISFLNRRFS